MDIDSGNLQTLNALLVHLGIPLAYETDYSCYACGQWDSVVWGGIKCWFRGGG